ncbi:TonB-dependent receptor [Comamonas flocculans]|uniref:TonB-dependent receptor n=1 Tax=Comamonas flocculans TaxID=2597701 RepID=A0A5B8RVP9_9BURK|nr:TonB-dependent receptor [Comamonas flocculans]QEA13616.1 TonB-dependent receptor [Comamonas flocculans]
MPAASPAALPGPLVPPTLSALRFDAAATPLECVCTGLRPRRGAVALAVLLACLWAAQALAQDAAASAALPVVSVTAKGYAASDAESPVATTVLTEEDLARKQAQNLGEALKGEPGLATASDSAQGQNPVIRGLQKDSVVLMVDGMRLNSAQPAGSIASSMGLALAERVEVVKGPASVLYGTGALGGAINVLLPQARFEPGVSLKAQLGYDSASRGKSGAAVLNASQGDHALMLGAALADYDDYRAPGGRQALTGYAAGSFIGQYRYRIDGQQQLRVSLQQQTDRDIWYVGSTKPHPLPTVGQLTTHSPRQTRRLAEVGYNRQGNGDQPLNLDVRLYRQEMQRSINARASLLGRDIVTNDVGFVTHGLDVRADWLVHPQHVLSIGLNTWRMAANPDSQSAAPPQFTQFTPSKPFTDGSLQATGLYAQDDMKFGALSVLAGLRYDSVRGNAVDMANHTVSTGLARSDGALSGSLGAVYEVTPLLRPFANLSRGFRAPDLRERYQSGARNDGYFWAGSPQLKPEHATQFELGLKGADATLDYSVSAWRMRVSDYITGMQLSSAAAQAACGAGPNATWCKQSVNLGHASLNGVEASLRWRFTPGQTLWAAYTRIRGTNGDLDEPLFMMPADSLTLGWEGRVAPAWTLDAAARLVRRQSRVATRFTHGTEDATPGYGVLDVGATWRYAKDQSLRLAIKNLADKRYHDHLAEGLPGMEALAPGRSLAVSWQGRF